MDDAEPVRTIGKELPTYFKKGTEEKKADVEQAAAKKRQRV